MKKVNGKRNMMLRNVLLAVCALMLVASFAWSKTVYYPAQFSTSPWNEWSPNNKYESTNFVVFWGALVGTSPTTYSDPNLRFDPAAICNYLEQSFSKFVNEIGFVTDTGNLGTYKIIVVMNDTYAGSGGPTGWAFGGQYDGVIGAIWIHPNATRDAYVLSHEFAHALQCQNRIQQNTSGGFTDYEPAGWFWEAHANYMRCQQFPQFASDDMPRWLGTRSFHLSSTRHHYDAFRWLLNIQQNYGGIAQVNNLWKQSAANETPIAALMRLKGWSQSQLNDFMYDYAKREVVFDYPALSAGSYMRSQVNTFKNSTADNHYLWRYYTILSQVSGSSDRFVVPDYAAPQDYGYNIIPLYSTCSSGLVHIKFKGHTEVNSMAGWRWGFVAVKSDGTTATYSPVYNTTDGEASYQMASDDAALYLVVTGAPTIQTAYVWEPGFPRIYRYPYEVRIENALPEGYQSNFRSDIKSLYAGHTHSNGGGWIANTATVASTVYVGPKAVVLGSSNLSGSVVVDGTARLENVTANTSVVFNGNANVWGGSYTGTAQILEGAILNSCTVSGNTIVKGDAMEWGVTFGGYNVVVGGDAEIASCSTTGVYYQCPHTNNGRTECDGKSASDISNTDINAGYSLFSDSQMTWTAVGCGSTTPDPTAAVTDSPTPDPTTPPSVTAAPTDTPGPTAIPTATPAGVTVDPTTPPSVTADPTTPPADTIAPTPDPTTPPSETPAPGGCTCTNLCTSQTSKTVPFSYDGAGEYCWVSSSIGTYINSWNTDAVNVNGTNYTNTYASGSSIPAINGAYYIYYKGSYSWSHFEAK